MLDQIRGQATRALSAVSGKLNTTALDTVAI